jgi:hypothetical protein
LSPGGLRLAALLAALLAPACRRKHLPVSSVPQLPYPQCGPGALPVGDVLAEGHLRSGPFSVEQLIDEHFSLRQRDCLLVLTVRQEWPLGVADVEVVYDRSWLPLRAWKRMTLPGVRRADGMADIRRYELRTPSITITRLSNGARSYEILRGDRPTVVLGPGRGLLTAWIRRAHLGVGGRVREVALDIREALEVVRPVTLRREPDQYMAEYGRSLRVYTVYGRESVFVDEHDVVVGDLAGLRQDAVLHTPAPPPLPLYGAPDPVNTP